ncbi:MAG: tetratricopeptide repeat protein [Lewinellaceae bacterium]|nr:tetratricopeptide repeat protein [Saprospiraceae bacterium]MCB9344447.1 tetratricopeptide repeat protein [Lewinellaceae bacterium]
MDNRTEELIESYFSGSLNTEESRELQSIMDTDPAAAAEFEWQKKLAREISKLSLRESIQNTDWREASKPPFQKVVMWKKIAAIAASIAVILIAWFVMPQLGAPSSESIVAESFEHYPNKMKFKSMGGSEEIVSQEVIDAFSAYDGKDYTTAISKLESVVNQNPDRLDYQFYLGVAETGNKDYQRAVNTLSPVAQSANSAYNTVAKYYLGVAYAGLKDRENARKYLKAYLDATDGVSFRKQAQKLLDKGGY